MAKPRSLARVQGFSLVEMLVALVFTGVLMAGMATVFKTSLSTFYTSGEVLSSARRNRMSIDLLGDDLNTAGMYLVDLSVPPPVLATTPPFFILPNMKIKKSDGVTDATIQTGDPATTDELYFYLDQPLPFEGTLSAAAPAQTAAELVISGVAPGASANTFSIDCGNETYAKQVKQGQVFIFKDSWETAYVSANPAPPTGSVITVVAGPDPNALVTGTGSAGLPSKAKHLPNSGIVFILPAQMVRYRIQMLQLDPLNANGTPCLVRDQGVYNGAGFAATLPQQIITENVSGFKVYLSTNATTWAGLGLAATGFAAGWDATTGIRGLLDTQLATSGRPDFKTTRSLSVGEHWFRSIPTLVRVDIGTRAATQRSEYVNPYDPDYNAANPKMYRKTTQSLIFVPRHFGLTMN